MQSQITTLPVSGASARIAPALAALLLGLALFLTAGFAGATVLHNSTHDTRHAFGLPCH
jgi:cobalt transporter subunit CbtB